MRLVIDTDVWVLAEKSGGKPNLARWAHHGNTYVSAVSASELPVGVERANSAQRRVQRGAFVESILASIPILEFSAPVARTHARMLARLPKKQDGHGPGRADRRHGLASRSCVAHSKRCRFQDFRRPGS